MKSRNIWFKIAYESQIYLKNKSNELSCILPPLVSASFRELSSTYKDYLVFPCIIYLLYRMPANIKILSNVWKQMLAKIYVNTILKLSNTGGGQQLTAFFNFNLKLQFLPYLMWSHKFYLPFDIKPIISKGKNLNSPKNYNLLVTSHTCACHWPTKVTWPVGHVTWEWGREGRREGERLADGSIPLKKIARDCTTTHDSRTLQLRD